MADYVLFLDDERNPPEAREYPGMEIVVARTPFEFTKAVKERGGPAVALFDWYLGSGWSTGDEMARWLVEYDRKEDVLKEDFLFHSQSSDAQQARRIVRFLRAYMAEKFSGGPPAKMEPLPEKKAREERRAFNPSGGFPFGRR